MILSRNGSLDCLLAGLGRGRYWDGRGGGGKKQLVVCLHAEGWVGCKAKGVMPTSDMITGKGS